MKAWRANARHCSPECRPLWHLVPGRPCRGPGCPNDVLVGSGRGRPRSYCSDGCRLNGEAEDKRRRRAGAPTRAEEDALQDAVAEVEVPFGLDAEAQFRSLARDGQMDSFGLDRRGRVNVPPGAVRGLAAWLVGGGDWPGMVPGLSEPALPRPVLGSWEPWNAVS